MKRNALFTIFNIIQCVLPFATVPMITTAERKRMEKGKKNLKYTI